MSVFLQGEFGDSNAPLKVFPQRGDGGDTWGLDQQKITSSMNLTEHFDTGMGPQIENLEEIICKFKGKSR